MIKVALDWNGLYSPAYPDADLQSRGRDPRRISLAEWEQTFTEGRCWELAIKLAEMTGWDLCRDVCETHAFIQLPDGRYLDIRGVHERSDLASAWSDPVRLVDTGDDALTYFHDWGFSQYDMDDDILTMVAQKLLRKHRLTS